jgi:alginate O-acetyltransferase complex protein AlgI
MLFNTFSYAIFLPIVFLLFWWAFKGKKDIQNGFLLLVSYFFYSFWDWRFLFLLLFSTLIDYLFAKKIVCSKTIFTKKVFFWSSIIINLGFLGVFKYYNFFSHSLITALGRIGIHMDLVSLSIILPVGISFYTFHGLSYIIDVYKHKIEPENNFVEYALFVSFFPLLVAGPIERATHLLPQIKKKKIFNYHQSVDGMKQILWGLFKKVVIADNCAKYANEIFTNYENLSGSTLFIGAFYFTIQIYGDFSGYSDIALGTARLFGIELLKNFSFPYFSRDISEFWRRWHISLTTWFKDYVYIPLGGSRVGLFKQIINTFIIFILSGLWHGANWTFLFWGVLNALYFIPLLIFKRNRRNLNIVAENRFIPSFNDFCKIIITFVLVMFGWIFFRSISMHDALYYCKEIFSVSFFTNPIIHSYPLLLLISFFFIVEWHGRFSDYAIKYIYSRYKVLRYLLYYSLIFMIFWFSGEEQQFIYFQF